jgi:hypothetical protein
LRGGEQIGLRTTAHFSEIKSKNRSAALAERDAYACEADVGDGQMVTTNEPGPGMNAPVKAGVGIVFEPNGTVTLISKTVDYGHGHATPFFAQVLVDRLGIPFSRIRLYFIGAPPAAKRTPEQTTQPLSRADGCTSVLRCGDAIIAAGTLNVRHESPASTHPPSPAFTAKTGVRVPLGAPSIRITAHLQG